MAELSQETINEFVIASHSDFDKVKTMLAEQPELLNANAVWKETPIQAAAHVGNDEIAEYFLAHGAPLDICTAAMLGRNDDVFALLDADPLLVNAEGAHRLPLMFYAALKGNIVLTAALLERGVPINGEGSMSPLHGAVAFSQAEMVKWLLANGADTGAKDFNGKTPLELAESNEHAEIADLLRG